ncbi:DUF6461 domain-containing protein [Nocardia sp. BMG111209]|uniref:DUF6461 domain-containing protein n=1 Tax=Nocardia sp. BMG111209 TaxID=1160137 RepID=UPI001E30235F|nr:DUF6461 domain-containing protein [Nocardia sp. BMG111209]
MANDDPNHCVHVVRGLEPTAALEVLGAKPRWFRTCELPGSRPDEWTSLPAAALAADEREGAALLAGRIGEWTFVYDDSGATDHSSTRLLSADGRVAATSMLSINADASLTYWVDGNELAWVDVDNLDLEADLPGMPDELRVAFENAGTFDLDYLDPGMPDYSIGMRAVSMLAGMCCTLDDLRRIPLVVTLLG